MKSHGMEPVVAEAMRYWGRFSFFFSFFLNSKHIFLIVSPLALTVPATASELYRRSISLEIRWVSTGMFLTLILMIVSAQNFKYHDLRTSIDVFSKWVCAQIQPAELESFGPNQPNMALGRREAFI